MVKRSRLGEKTTVAMGAAMQRVGCQSGFGQTVLTTVAVVLFALAGCRTNNRISLDPLKDKNDPAANDPLKGRSLTTGPSATPAGQARLMAPDLGTGGTPSNPDATSPTLGGPTTAALASNSRIGLESPKGSANASANSSTKPASWTPSSGITWDQAREMLKARGASWSPPEMGSDGLWHFRCSVANPDNPSLSRVYEASDVSDLGAVKKALANLGS